MAIPQTKLELTHSIATTYEKLREELNSISAEYTLDKELEGHGKGSQMSVNDLVAYLIGWGELVLKWHRTAHEGKEVVFPEEGFKWTELGKLAQKFYQDYAGISYPDLLIRLDQTVELLQNLIANTPEDILYAESFYSRYPLGRMIQLNSAAPYKNARARLRKWKKQFPERF